MTSLELHSNATNRKLGIRPSTASGDLIMFITAPDELDRHFSINRDRAEALAVFLCEYYDFEVEKFSPVLSSFRVK